ncbi:MAG: Arm DNA-binding domain-containing protein [Alphaproteobacteria bacterium]|nr:Arm DNA-binding domain-containing protein [Alphaproteobacteria bacterium]
MAGKLTELQVKNAKPGAAKYTRAAGRGLTLIVMRDGSKYWRLRYRFGGKARMIAVGKPYPHTTLKQAQATAAEYRAAIEAGVDRKRRRRPPSLGCS